MTDLQRFVDTAPTCEGYAVDRLSYSRIEELDSLEIALRWGPDKPDVVYGLRNVSYFAAENDLEPGIIPIDRFVVSVVEPGSGVWPAGVPRG